MTVAGSGGTGTFRREQPGAKGSPGKLCVLPADQDSALGAFRLDASGDVKMPRDDKRQAANLRLQRLVQFRIEGSHASDDRRTGRAI